MTRVITWTLVGFGVLFIALLVFLGVAIGVEGAAGWVARFRDAMIVTVGVFQIITSVLTIALLMALLFAIVQINNQIQRTVIPKVEQVTAKVDGILENTRSISERASETSRTVSATTAFTAERVASPFIRVTSMLAGVRAAATALARRDEDTILAPETTDLSDDGITDPPVSRMR
ncbi:MAG: hypothetical protein HC914_18370 [Chloroflexaceae bacterium]|nr:hypothetical protein [Chloroflexaceae bacterium]